MHPVAKRVRETAISATVQIGENSAALRAQGVDVMDLASGRAAEHSPDYVNEAAARAVTHGGTHQTLSRGSLEFRRACAAKLARENGLTADPEREVLATMGVKQGLTLALTTFVNPGDEVLIEDPCFVSYRPLIELAGGIPRPVPLRVDDGFRWKREALDAAFTERTRAILFNSPHNPTGVVHTLEDLQAVAAVARDRNLLVITDEIYERLTFGGRLHRSIASLPDMRDRTLTVMGLGKAFAMGGWRIGFVFASSEAISAMTVMQQHLITCANSFVQAGASAVLSEEPHPAVQAMWRDWSERLAFALAELRRIPGVTCRETEGGYYAWPNVSSFGRTSAELAEDLLLRHHVAVVPGSAFGSAGEGYLRVTCTRSWPELREGLARMQKALA